MNRFYHLFVSDVTLLASSTFHISLQRALALKQRAFYDFLSTTFSTRIKFFHCFANPHPIKFSETYP